MLLLPFAFRSMINLQLLYMMKDYLPYGQAIDKIPFCEKMSLSPTFLNTVFH